MCFSENKWNEFEIFDNTTQKYNVMFLYVEFKILMVRFVVLSYNEKIVSDFLS